MPQRIVNAWYVVVGIAGLVLVGALVLFGADLGRASRTGPRWKRRLLTAALALLSSAGVYLAARPLTAADRPSSVDTAGPLGLPKGELAQTPHWKRLMATWKEADDVGSGRRGAYPFNAKGKKALLAWLGTSDRDVDALAAAGMLTAPEAALLKKELARLTEGVQFKRPTEMKGFTCYVPMMPLTWPGFSRRRIDDRLPLLRRLADAETVHPQVAAKVLETLETDLKRIQATNYLKQVKDREEVEKTIQTVQALVVKLKARPSLKTAAHWRTILAAWRFAKPLADSHKSTSAQRVQADRHLKAATAAAAELAKAGAISDAEAGLLADEADAVRTEMRRKSPTDFKGKCYETIYIPPARESFDRLSKRLSLLQKLAAAGKVNPAVVKRVLPTVRADLATLADPKQAKALQPARRARLEKITADTQAAVAKIEKLLEPHK